MFSGPAWPADDPAASCCCCCCGYLYYSDFGAQFLPAEASDTFALVMDVVRAFIDSGEVAD